MGGCCCRCRNGAYLEMDCIKPMGAEHHLVGSQKRIQFYELEFERGNLQLLCQRCHRQKHIDERRRPMAVSQ